MMILACGILVAVSVYLLLDVNLVRQVFGLVLLGSAINLILLLCGRLQGHFPVFISKEAHQLFANPLPQALILTAIVIGFALFAYLCVLLKVKYGAADRKETELES